MSKYDVIYSKKFKKSLKKVTKQGKDINKLLDIVDKLATKETLEPKYKDHALYDNKRFKGCRDCHIEPDWVLIYKYLEEEIVLLLVNTGSHSDILD